MLHPLFSLPLLLFLVEVAVFGVAMGSSACLMLSIVLGLWKKGGCFLEFAVVVVVWQWLLGLWKRCDSRFFGLMVEMRDFYVIFGVVQGRFSALELGFSWRCLEWIPRKNGFVPSKYCWFRFSFSNNILQYYRSEN